VREAREHLSRNTFGAGSMKPKVEAAVWFVTHGSGRKVIITDSAHSVAALAGKAGTTVVR